MGASYHAIVIGGGHNGLVAGSYLARSGARTVVLEARSKVGGAVDTSAPFADHPEIKVSTYSYVMSLMPAFLIEQLELTKHGYHVTPFGPTTRRSPTGARSRSTATTRRRPTSPSRSSRSRTPRRCRRTRRGCTASPRSSARCCTRCRRTLARSRSATCSAVEGGVDDALARHARGRRRDAPVHDEPVRAARPLVRVRRPRPGQQRHHLCREAGTRIA